jgi:hypothetical protein
MAKHRNPAKGAKGAVKMNGAADHLAISRLL